MRELGRKTRLAAAMVAVALAFAGCSGGGPKAVEVSSEADLAGLRVGCTAGSIYEMMLSQRADIELSTFNTPSDDVEALVSGKVDVMVEDDTFMSPEEMARTGIKLAFRGETQFPVAYAFRKGDAATAPVREGLSRFIDSLRATGELQKMHDRWFECDTPSRVAMPNLGPEPEGKPITVGSVVNMPPIAFPVGRDWRGFESEVLLRYSRHAGRPVEINYVPLASATTALQTGNIDILCGGIFVTEERQKTIDFSSVHYYAYPGFFVRTDGAGGVQAGFWERMRQTVHNNLIVEARWRYIVEGLWETVKISLLSILLGSLLGAGVCWMRMSRRHWVSQTAKVYISLMRGIPMLVFLMIMFYVVLAGTGLSATMVAVVAFALNFAAYVSEMFRTAIDSVGKGQTEAGLAIGFTRWQTFFYIVAPQALRSVMPVYKGEAVSLVKNTSIVGYIAIQDLTRASDMIRNRTFDAFFPLLLVTVIYFVLAWLLGKLLDLTVRNTAKK